MKRMLAILLICSCTAVFFGSCKEKPQSDEISKMEIVHPDVSFDSESNFYIDENSNTVTDNMVQGGFEVKEKKYTFYGTDHVILFTENQTDKNYTVTVTGTYYDANGNALKTEQHTFAGFGAGYQNCFLFSPNMKFDTFEYTLKAVEYNGICYAQHVDMKLSELRESRWPIPQLTDDHFTYYPMIDTSLYYHCDYEERLAVGAVFAVFDDKDELAYLSACGKSYIPPMGETASGGLVLHYELTEGEMVWPEWLKNGDFTTAVILLAVSPNDEDVPIPLNIYPHLTQWHKEE